MTQAILKPPQDVHADCISEDAFKKNMRALAGTVTVISTGSEHHLHGFTATAVCSVCADPATLLIAVNRSTRTHDHIAHKGGFVVNILSKFQKDIAHHFASKGEDQFASIGHTVTQKGLPVIHDTAAYFECLIDQIIVSGTHSLFIGRVIDAGSSGEAPLMYHDANYCHLQIA